MANFLKCNVQLITMLVSWECHCPWTDCQICPTIDRCNDYQMSNQKFVSLDALCIFYMKEINLLVIKFSWIKDIRLLWLYLFYIFSLSTFGHPVCFKRCGDVLSWKKLSQKTAFHTKRYFEEFKKDKLQRGQLSLKDKFADSLFKLIK
jgi:hypothetical protein